MIATKLSRKFGPNLRDLRERAGLKQTALAEKLGVSGPFVSMLEASERVPSLETIEKICRIFGVQVGDLFK